MKNLENYHREIDENVNVYCPRKEALKRREKEDEWAKIINDNHLKYIEENETAKKKEQNKKNEYSNILKHQIQEKDNLRKTQRDSEKLFHEKIFMENVKNEENEDNVKQKNYKKKCLENKELVIKEYKGDKYIK